jgi:hypothetical protein
MTARQDKDKDKESLYFTGILPDKDLNGDDGQAR